MLNENGSGAEYRRSRQYFHLPLAYFLNGWYDKLSLPGTVALLIALDRSRTKEWFELPKERAAGWFAISADTLQRGLDELRVDGLIEVKQRPVTLTVGEVAERAGLGQSTASEHLVLLRRGGLVHATRDGKTVRYRVDSTRISTELDQLKAYLTVCCPPTC